jgi:hypothetical protein
MSNYFVNPNMTDQGAARAEDDFVCGPESLKEIIDFIGTTNQATIILESKSVAQTTYTLTTSETIPSNITLKIWPGAVLDGAGTLTIDGGFEAGLNKVFGSTITVTFGDSAIRGVYPQWWESNAGIDSTVDCTTAVQSAINACVGSAAGHYKNVLFVPGNYSFESTVTMKTAGLIGLGTLNSGVRFLWNGVQADTAFEKDSSHEGNNSFVRIENISFIGVANNPDYWLDFSTNTGVADAHFRLRELQFNGTAKSPIKLSRWLNCHLEHIRFDNWGEYCIDIVVPASPAGAMGSFVLDGFTADAITQDAIGMFHINTEAAEISNWGPFEVANGRIEINTQMNATNPGIFVLDIPDATAYTRSIGFKLRNVSIQDSASSSVYILQRLTTNTTAGETLILENVRVDSIAGLVAGTPGTNFNNIPYTTGNISYLALNVAGATIPGNAFDMTLLAPYSTNDALRMQNKDDSQARFTLDSNAYLNWGPGNGAVDTRLYRSGAGVMQMGSGDHFKVDGTWNGGVIQMGAYYLWVDSTGDLRIKSGAPANDTDGTVVGAQT